MSVILLTGVATMAVQQHIAHENARRDDIFRIDNDGNRRLETRGGQTDLDDSMRERADNFLPDRDQARQEQWDAWLETEAGQKAKAEWQEAEAERKAEWEEAEAERKAEWEDELARREAYPDIYGCPTELGEFEAGEFEHGEFDLVVPELYAVRGARLRCDKGTHIRRLNLPKDHGVYITGSPMVHKHDCVPGDDANIATFGVCEAPRRDRIRPVPPTIILKRRKYNEYTGEIMETEEDLPNVRGLACKPQIAGYWLNTHDDTRIVDNGDNISLDVFLEDSEHGYPAVTTESILVCACGGIIDIVDSGQNLKQRIEDYEAGLFDEAESS